ncbi:protoporphyrinogen/coproporphyrinogen oxidase [Actinokineospora globicatena]|uniref:protoporphyrinogen/coproporphyrinogen oxidase n=1 Tax=Actinokineospora globicatena TaxID=103729 RepID=UPI0020A3FD7A|nr:FAD-dependent oxidoreductase [Actinokineospora globicatena]MCP2302277.1 oxygen-dependent protoporphyrinogen oxidase [Actinokineospora globicatena]GLW76057.1 protoporphyrinogen oxidase [Actinokineospora globicatena]GLW82892.1 protoporphyrinogen oxidase [Actinokineospora globicatena]
MSPDLDVAVVGAGIAGLAAAYRLRAQGRSVHVFESGEHIGGRMRTERRDGYLADTGAEMIGSTGYPATWRLIEDLRITDAEVPLIGADLAVWRDGRARGHVGDPLGLLTGAGLGVPARLTLLGLLGGAAARRRAYDVDAPEATPLGGRTIAEISRGDLHDYLFQPLAGGYFGWDTAQACAGPFLSHTLAVGATKTFRTFRDGMDTLALRLADQVEVSTGVPVREVVTTDTGARLVADRTPLTARTVVLAVPAPIAVDLHPGAPEYVRQCQYRPMVKVVCLLSQPLEGLGRSFALAVPEVENQVLAGLVIDDRKHPARVPTDRGMVSLVATPSAVPALLDQTDDEISRTLISHAERYLPGIAHALRTTIVSRFTHGLPMPTRAALGVRTEFAGRAPSSVEYVGDWYALRPSSEAAVRSAELVAERLSVVDAPAVARG